MSDLGTEKYGNKYYCVKVPKSLSKNGEIYVMADEVHLVQGALFFRSTELESGPVDNLVLAPGMWSCYYAASVLDGSAIAVEHWKGEVE